MVGERCTTTPDPYDFIGLSGGSGQNPYEFIRVFRGAPKGGFARGRFEVFVAFGKKSGRFSIFVGPPRALEWPETDSPRKMIANSGVETRIRALGTRFVATFRF